jgi:hypothetical protein
VREREEREERERESKKGRIFSDDYYLFILRNMLH